MKRVLIEVPDNVDSSEIFYWNGFQYVKVNKHIKEAMRKSAVMPLAPMAPPSRKEFEALRSRVEKLEQESERQCARVIKMEEGISDDLK